MERYRRTCRGELLVRSSSPLAIIERNVLTSDIRRFEPAVPFKEQDPIRRSRSGPQPYFLHQTTHQPRSGGSHRLRLAYPFRGIRQRRTRGSLEWVCEWVSTGNGGQGGLCGCGSVSQEMGRGGLQGGGCHARQSTHMAGLTESLFTDRTRLILSGSATELHTPSTCVSLR